MERLAVASDDEDLHCEMLREGQAASIGDLSCRIKTVLGQGSFGVVWGAEELDCASQKRSLAIKEITCGWEYEVQNAQFEAQLLQMNAEWNRDAVDDSSGRSSDDADSSGLPSECQGRVPILVASDTAVLCDGQWRVRIAMTRVGGRDLDMTIADILKERAPRDFERSRRRHGDAVAAAGLAYLTRDLQQATCFAREMFRQLAPVAECISRVALHRDINAHNVLVDLDADGVPSFGLVDFGLGVDKACFQQEAGWEDRLTRVCSDGSKTWHQLDVGGDCRYWPISAWMQFLHGCDFLEQQASLKSEYLIGLDLHPFGVTALEIFVKLMPHLEGFERHDLDWKTTPQPLIAALERLQRRWWAYWDFVTPVHAVLMSVYQGAGTWDDLKRRCTDDSVGEVLCSRLRDIRACLREVQKSCDPCAGICGDVNQLCAALLLTISAGGAEYDVRGGARATWKEAQRRWRKAFHAVRGRSPRGASSGSRYCSQKWS